jgi:hypothetical protein
MKIAKNNKITPHRIIRVNKALSGKGNVHFFILILEKRSTRGLPIIERIPATSM